MNLTPDIKTRLERLRPAVQARQARVFGVEYTRITIPNQGDLYLTRFGLPFLEHLLPTNWNDKEYYRRPENRHLKLELEGSAHPHHITTKPVDGKSIEIVAKWCRMGSEVQVHQSKRADFITDDEFASARWNSPFEEFGLIEELRQSNRYYDRRLLTQRPFAIYSPTLKHQMWQTGRNEDRMRVHYLHLQRDQYGLPSEQTIELDIHRSYAMLFGWVKGLDAVRAFEALGLDLAELDGFTRAVYNEDLKSRGYCVLDTKPEHFIVRTNNGGLVREKNSDRIAYALVDFELLQRTEDYDKRFQLAQRQKFWRMQRRRDARIKPLPEELSYTSILGVDYVAGMTSNKGRLWVVGNEPDLFDFYDPSRWRSNPRVQLSSITFRTRSSDGIMIIYRISGVGMAPRYDPATPIGPKIREFGNNSPFEEVAIAENLRRLGVKTVYPRAIYRTAHESLPADWLATDSRYRSHANLRTVDGEPVLHPNHDYYTLWGYWRGVDPMEDYSEERHWGVIDVEQAVNSDVLSEKEYQKFIERVMQRLARIGFPPRIRNDRLILQFENGQLIRNREGFPKVIICVNGLLALEHNLLTLDQYNDLLDSLRAKLRDHGYEALDLKGNQFLLAMDLDGNLKRESDGQPEAILSNFELIRAPWMHY